MVKMPEHFQALKRAAMQHVMDESWRARQLGDPMSSNDMAELYRDKMIILATHN